MRDPMTLRSDCFWCGHTPHTEGAVCGQPTYFLKTPCECRARQEQPCKVCGRPVDVVDGVTLHRLPRADFDELRESIPARRRWGAEIGFFTLATAGHQARVA